MKRKEIFKICALRDRPFGHITFGMTPSASMLQGVCSSLYGGTPCALKLRPNGQLQILG
jgi:hypothetical protein